MAEIEEVPISDAPAEDVEEPVPAEVAPKKRGRPKGSANKPKPVITAKPKRAPAARKRQATPDESEEDAPPPPPRKRRARVEELSQDSVSPEPHNTRDIAAEVLHLLSHRHVERNAAKRLKYASWFLP